MEPTSSGNYNTVSTNFLASTTGAQQKDTDKVSMDAKYNKLLDEMNKILKKDPPSEKDTKELSDILKTLKEMQGTPEGQQNAELNNCLSLIFAVFEQAGATSNNGFTFSSVEIVGEFKKFTFTDPNDPTKTDKFIDIVNTSLAVTGGTLGDDLLDFAHWSYNMYTDQLKAMKDQIDASTNTINDVKEMQEILNMIHTDDPGNYKMPPENWDDIPKELQDKFKAMYPEEFEIKTTVIDTTLTNNDYWNKIPKSLQEELINANTPTYGISPMNQYMLTHNFTPPPLNELDSVLGKGYQDKVLKSQEHTITTSSDTPKDFSKINGWIKGHMDTYVGWSTDYFKSPLATSVVLIPDATTVINDLLTTRSDLEKQLDVLKKGGAHDEKGNPIVDKGSPADTIQKVLDDLNKYFPPNKYPAGSTYTIVKSAPGMYDTSGNFVAAADPTADLTKYIKDAQTTNNTINDTLDKALEANQNLSTKMSDDIKAKNLTLQEHFDILSQISDALSKIILGFARIK